MEGLSAKRASPWQALDGRTGLWTHKSSPQVKEAVQKAETSRAS